MIANHHNCKIQGWVEERNPTLTDIARWEHDPHAGQNLLGFAMLNPTYGTIGQTQMVGFNDIQDAFLFVSSAPYGINSAVLCINTGQILYRSEMGTVDEIEDAELDWEMCIAIPHKNDLKLGQSLAFEFVATHIPDAYEQVRQLFRSRGAYGRFKSLLERKGLLENWYNFERRREEETLRLWCRDNEIQLSD